MRTSLFKYGLAIALGCVYVAGSAWVVQSAGRSYRDSLRRHRVASQSGTKGENSAVAENAPEKAATSRAVPSEAPREVAEHDARASIARAETPEHATPTPPAAQPAPAPPDTKRELPTAAVPPPNTPPPSAQPSMIPPSQDPFWNAPALAEVWDLSKLKAEDETRLGDALHAVILHFNERLEEGPWLRRVEEAAEPLLALRTRKDIRYTFTILNSDSVNAFSTPGGYIYFSRELFDLIGEDEDYALQFVVGHEIAHVDLQHAIKCLEDPGVKQLSGGTLKLLYFLVVPWGYLEKQDYEADRWVYQRMSALGRTKRESLAFLRKFEGYARTNGFENLRAGPAPGAEGSPLENHFRAHPIPRHRLKELEVLQSKPRQ